MTSSTISIFLKPRFVSQCSGSWLLGCVESFIVLVKEKELLSFHCVISDTETSTSKFREEKIGEKGFFFLVIDSIFFGNISDSVMPESVTLCSHT